MSDGAVSSSKELSAGFRQFLPSGGKDNGQQAAGVSGGQDSAIAPQTNKLVKFRGSVLDLEQLMDKLDK